jgi:hypothetical protein
MNSPQKLTKDQKRALTLQARNMAAIRKIKERYAKQESEQEIAFQNGTPENDTGTEVGNSIESSANEQPQQVNKEVQQSSIRTGK